MLSTSLKNMSQNGNLPQIGINTKNLWNHHLVLSEFLLALGGLSAALGSDLPNTVGRGKSPWSAWPMPSMPMSGGSLGGSSSFSLMTFMPTPQRVILCIIKYLVFCKCRVVFHGENTWQTNDISGPSFGLSVVSDFSQGCKGWKLSNWLRFHRRYEQYTLFTSLGESKNSTIFLPFWFTCKKPSVRAEFVLIQDSSLNEDHSLKGNPSIPDFSFHPPTSSASKLIKFPSYPPVVSLTWHPTWGNSEIFIVSKKCRRW